MDGQRRGRVVIARRLAGRRQEQFCTRPTANELGMSNGIKSEYICANTERWAEPL